MSLSAAERETVLICNDEMNQWEICTFQSKVITKLRKAGLEPYKVDSNGGHYYKDIDFTRVSFRNASKRKPMTEKQREAAAERLKKAREAKK